MKAKDIKTICREFVALNNIQVIDGKIYDCNNKKRMSDDSCRKKLLNQFDEEVDARNVDAIIDTLKLMECPNYEGHTIASVNGLNLIAEEDYDLNTYYRLIDTFGEEGYQKMIKWAHDLLTKKIPKQALNIYGKSNFGKSYFIDNIFGRIFNTCPGDWQGEWTIQKASDDTELIMFVDKDKGCIPSNKWEWIKQTHQGRECFIEVNPKCGAKYEIFAGLTSLIQTQLPARLWKPDNGYLNEIQRKEFEQEELAFNNRMIFVEFKINNVGYPWHWDTIYSLIVRGGIEVMTNWDVEDTINEILERSKK